MQRSHTLLLSTLAVAAAALALSGCTDEKIVYRDGTNFAAPKAAAANFVGYSDATNKKTVCGSCHAEIQASWVDTKHAVAWSDLVASGSQAGYCNGCHTTGAYGNLATAGGFAGDSTTARYHDVQCESCHGAGLTHISSPTSGNRPLASIKADTGLANGCGECHSGSHDPFLEEWKVSGHSKTFATSHSSTDPSCQACHTAQGFLTTQANVTHNYVEKNGAMLDVTCAACHDPHGSANSAQLRFPINTTNLDNNLCTKCHRRNGTSAEVTTRNSVHSPEGPTLFGTAGWIPASMVNGGAIVSSHGDATKNPGLCATCHVSKYEGTDPLTKTTVFSTGHRFLATPCVGANGLPTVAQDCEIATQSFRSCVSGGCHGSETLARNATVTAEARVTLLVGEANRLITLIKAGPKAADCTFATTKAYSVCNGVQFNISLTSKAGGIIHNPFLLEQLMIASINQLKSDYGVVAAAGIDLTPQLQKAAKGFAGGR
ncbi:MAG TPA: multiheme c-type cytochrome [Gemmatimonadaceae bacterium]